MRPALRGMTGAGFAAAVLCGVAVFAAGMAFADISDVAPSTPQEPPRISIPVIAPPGSCAIPRVDDVLHLDGVLDEDLWAKAAVVPLPYEVEPGNSTPAGVETRCLLAYDLNNLYVAFHALDSDPASIRANLIDRDQAYRHDYVGVALDTFNDGRRGFEFFCNPLGVQMDLSRNDLNREQNEDETWDAIWGSAGKITTDGYVVEMEIPFASLRFPRTEDMQTWGIVCFRTRPRELRYQYSSMPIDRDRDCFICQAGKATGLRGIRPGRSIELDPTLTSHRRDSREEFVSPALAKGPVKADLGLSARWGITPNLSLNAAANPDFSQIEADAVQLDINTRYALYYAEKRPFFLEGSDFFGTPLDAVYTRAVADPDWGVKLTGKEGPHAIGMFVTRDNRTNLILASNQMSDLVSIDRPATTSVVRYRRDVGASSTAGILLTDREGSGYHNRLYGADGFIQMTGSDVLLLQVLGTSTRYPGDRVNWEMVPPGRAFGGFGAHVGFNHEDEHWAFWLNGTELDHGFRADAGYIPRVDVRQVETGINRRIYGVNTWFSRLDFSADVEQANETSGRMTDRTVSVEASYIGPMQTGVELDGAAWKEEYAGRMYSGALLRRLHFEFQPGGSFKGWFSGGAGDVIDYANRRAATRLSGGPGFNLDIGRHLHAMVDHTYEHLDVHGRRLYTANIIDSRIAYQFNMRMYARLILQYENIDRHPDVYTFPVEPRTRHLYSQALGSYKINPRTVLYLGYSENREGRRGIHPRPLDRTFFLKIGYAWLI